MSLFFIYSNKKCKKVILEYLIQFFITGDPDIVLNLHLFIWKTLLSKATYNLGIHQAIHLKYV